MQSELTIKEKLYIEHLLKQNFIENKPANILSQVLLSLGSLIILYAIYFIGTHFNQKMFLETALLLLIIGFFTMGMSYVLKRIYDMSCDQHQMFNIIYKLTKMNHMLEPGAEKHPHLQF